MFVSKRALPKLPSPASGQDLIPQEVSFHGLRRKVVYALSAVTGTVNKTKQVGIDELEAAISRGGILDARTHRGEDDNVVIDHRDHPHLYSLIGEPDV